MIILKSANVKPRRVSDGVKKVKKCVKATNIETNEVLYFDSFYAVNQHLQTNSGSVKNVCDSINGCKLGISKKDGKSYKFEYVKKEDMPDDYLKSAGKRSKILTDKEKKKRQYEAFKKWLKKEHKCSRCDKIIKNGSKYLHRKICF